MSDRAILQDRFLDSSGWGDAASTIVAGDASNRKYFRLTRSIAETAILMDAPSERGEDVRPFIKIAQYLNSIGLSAPAILAEDLKNGFLLLEDLGDDLFARVLENTPTSEHALYMAATDALLHQHSNPPPKLQIYDTAVMVDMAALAFDCYFPTFGIAADKTTCLHILAELLDQHANPLDVMIQRDYHAENLLWLPSQQGVARVGMLDFQDAMIGHRAYDLMSLLQDARRDVPDKTEQIMIRHYVDQSGADMAIFKAAYDVLAVQRNLRILGVFARLNTQNDKSSYIDLIPRVLGYLHKTLKRPGLSQLANLLQEPLKCPSAEARARVKST